MASASSTFDGTENPLSEGGTWTSGPGGFVEMQKVSGVAKAAGAGLEYCARYIGTTFDSDHYSEVTAASTGTSGYFGAMTRMQSDTTNGGYLAVHYGGTTEIYRLANDAGSPNFTLLGASVSLSFAANDVLRLASNGSTHTLYKNGVSQFSRTDSTYTGGQPGIYNYDDTSDGITSWAGGDLRSPSSPPSPQMRLPMSLLAR